MVIIRSLFFYILVAIYTILFSVVISALSFLLSYKQISKIILVWCHLYFFTIKLICGVNYKIEGEENIPETGNALIISNHQSELETILLLMKFQPQATVLKQELLKIPFFGWGLKRLNPIAIDRSQKSHALKQILSEGSKRLKEGFWVVIYPEGTRQPAEARERFSAGGAMLAVKSGYPIIPVAHNAGVYCPGKSIIRKPGTITFVIGKPVPTTDRKSREVNEEVESWIHGQMDALK